MSRSRRRPAAKKQQADKVAARKFWGEIPTEEPPAVGQPDDPPSDSTIERPAQEAFAKLYNRAAAMAFGLAVAAGLDADTDA